MRDFKIQVKISKNLGKKVFDENRYRQEARYLEFQILWKKLEILNFKAYLLVSAYQLFQINSF